MLSIKYGQTSCNTASWFRENHVKWNRNTVMGTFLLYEDCPSSLWRAVWNRVVIFASYYIYGSCVFKVPCYKKIEYIKILYFLMNIMKYFQKVLYFRYFIHFCVLPFYIFFVLPFIRSVYTKWHFSEIWIWRVNTIRQIVNRIQRWRNFL